MTRWLPISVLVTYAPLALGQGTPTSLRPDVVVEHYMEVQPSASRMAYDHLQQQMHYLTTTGDVRVVLDNGIDPPSEQLLFTVADHAID